MFGKKRICEDCGTVGTGKRKPGGAFWVEILLWLLGIVFAPVSFGLSLIVPLAYSVGRTFNSEMVCKKCKGKMIDINTPKGQKLMKELGLDN